VADLILSIKSSRVPIICICNDRYSQKLKSLVNHCFALNYRKPTKQQVRPAPISSRVLEQNALVFLSLVHLNFQRATCGPSLRIPARCLPLQMAKRLTFIAKKEGIDIPEVRSHLHLVFTWSGVPAAFLVLMRLCGLYWSLEPSA